MESLNPWLIGPQVTDKEKARTKLADSDRIKVSIDDKL